MRKFQKLREEEFFQAHRKINRLVCMYKIAQVVM